MRQVAAKATIRYYEWPMAVATNVTTSRRKIDVTRYRYDVRRVPYIYMQKTCFSFKPFIAINNNSKHNNNRWGF